MQHLGDFRIDDYVTFGVQLHRFSSGAVYAPTGNVAYTFYENNSTSGAPTGGNLAQLNSKTGLYSARVQLTTAAGFEAGKDYFIHVEATVDSVAAAELFMFRVVDVPTVDVTKLGGSAQSATDLKDFADDGYDPSTNKVQGVVLVDTTTTVTNDPTGVGTLLSRLSAARAGYLDNLSGGAVALQNDLQSIQNNTRCVRVVPTIIERPDSGTQTYRIEVLLYDEVGNMEAPDSAPTVALVDQGGTDLSSRLDSATMALVSTGRYRCVYTASDTDDLEQLVWAFTVVESGNARVYGNTSIIVDTTAVDFTSTDRANLASILNVMNAQGATGSGLTNVPWNAAWDAEVQSECADALAATDSIGAASVSAAAANKIADHVLRRNSANVEASSNGDTLAFKSPYGGVAMNTHVKTPSGTDLLIKKADGTTTLATVALTTDASADPITGTGSA